MRSLWVSAAPLLLALSFAAGTGGPARASWLHGEAKDGSAAVVATRDATTGASIGVACRDGVMRAFAAPVPAGAAGTVQVSYEIDGIPIAAGWPVMGESLAVVGPLAEDLATRLLAMQDAIWFRIGEGPRSLADAGGLRDPLTRVMQICHRPPRP